MHTPCSCDRLIRGLTLLLSFGAVACAVAGESANQVPAGDASTAGWVPGADAGAHPSVEPDREPAGEAPVLGASEPPAPRGADLAMDSNRDGLVGLDDDAHEAEWSTTAGAVVLANVDDDDRDGRRDGENVELDGPDDAAGLAPLVVRVVPDLASGARAELSVEPAGAREGLRIYTQSGDVVFEPGDGVIQLAADALRRGDLALLVESPTGRTTNWDGHAVLALTVRDDAGVLSRDEVHLRVAPVIFPDDTLAAEQLFVMHLPGDNDAFFDALRTKAPGHIEVVDVDDDKYGGDQWLQDNMQTGVQLVPGVGGPARHDTFLQAQRDGDLERLVPDELLGAAIGYVWPGGDDTPHNYGGNLEVAPPHDGYPLGRLIVGGGSMGTLDGSGRTDRMTKDQRAWLDAQRIQGPSIEISTEWLSVGHVDEIFTALPDRSGTSTYGWKFVVASPALAMRVLADLDKAGQGSATVFPGRDEETTVSEVLGDSELRSFNDLAQARIDSVRLKVTEVIGLADDDWVEVPVLFTEAYDGPEGTAGAYNPAIQNLAAADGVLFVPDPSGPGAWRDVTRTALEALGHTVVFVDVYDSYHLQGGAAHCGTNFRRVPHAIPWWEVER